MDRVIFNHKRTNCHRKCTELAETFIAVWRRDRMLITHAVNAADKRAAEKNTEGMVKIINVLRQLAERNVPLREPYLADERKEDSNFLFFVNWQKMFDEEFSNFVDNSLFNAQYLSPKVQNEILQCALEEGHAHIRQDLKNSYMFALMFDESADVSQIDQLSVCVRYIKSNEVVENFVGYVTLTQRDVEFITDELVRYILNLNFPLDKLHFVSTDGCARMIGPRSGIVTRLRKVFPQIRFITVCRSHQLQLAVVHSCANVPEVRKYLDILTKLSFWILKCSKRKTITRNIIQTSKEVKSRLDLAAIKEHEEEILRLSQGKLNLPSLCETRWQSRINVTRYGCNYYYN